MDGTTDSTDKNLGKLQDRAKDRGVWCTAFLGLTKSQTGLGN